VKPSALHGFQAALPRRAGLIAAGGPESKRLDQSPHRLYASGMPPAALKFIESCQKLAGRMVLRAVKDLQHPEYCEEVKAWLNGSNARLTFQLCAHILGLDEEALRGSILKKAGNA